MFYIYIITPINRIILTNIKIMKAVLVRSFAVLLILAAVSISLTLTIFISGWFIPLTILSLFFLDMADSMLEWRIKSLILRLDSPLIWGYLAVAVISIIIFYYESHTLFLTLILSI